MKKGLNANTLKAIAIVAMLIDHTAFAFLKEGSLIYFFMRAIGRLAAPIMCFFIAEGYFHTKSLRRYSLRLLMFALISHVPYVLFVGTRFYESSIMLPLFLGLTALALYDMDSIGSVPRYAGIMLCFLLSVTSDWSCMPVLFVLLFGAFRDSPSQQMLRFGIVGAIFAVVSAVNDISMFYMSGILLAIPLLRAYSGKLGTKSKALKWSFYIFYPAHMLVLYFIDLAIA